MLEDKIDLSAGIRLVFAGSNFLTRYEPEYLFYTKYLFSISRYSISELQRRLNGTKPPDHL